MTSAGETSLDTTALAAAVGLATPPEPSLAAPHRRSVHRVVDPMMHGLDYLVEAELYVTVTGELVVMLWNVIARDLYKTSLTWADEVAQIMIAILAFLGGAFAHRSGRHAAIRLLISRLPGRWQDAQRAFSSLSVGAISILVLKVSLPVIKNEESLKTPILGISQAWDTIPLAVGMGLLALYSAVELIDIPLAAIVRGAGVFVVFGLLEYLLAPIGQSGGNSIDGAPVAWSSSVALVSFVVLLLCGVPVSAVLVTCGCLYLYNSETAPLNATTTNMTNGVSSILMFAIPFFILTGTILTHSGLSRRLFRVIDMFVGRLRGGMLATVVVAMYLFSGLSGSKIADVAAVGTPVVGALTDEDDETSYTREDVAAVLAASAVMGESVPPSVIMIILSSITNVSVISLFFAGVLPAAIVGVMLIATIWVTAKGRPRVLRPGVRPLEAALSVAGAVPILAIPVLLVVGILTGSASPTEASSIAVAGALLLALAYRSLNLHNLRTILSETVGISGTVLLIVSAASHFSWSLTVAGLPAKVGDLMTSLGDSHLAIFLVTLVVLPILGTVLEGLPAVLIFGPLLVPIAVAAGINPLQYEVLFVIAMGLGTFAPPMGVGLFSTCLICKTTVEKVARKLLPYWLTILAACVLLILVPEITLFLPQHFGPATLP